MMIQFSLNEMLTQYSLLGLPFLLMVLATLGARFVIKER